MTEKKTCFGCGNLYYYSGTLRASDVTPGCPPDMGCLLEIWKIDPYRDFFDSDLEDYRNKIYTADNCEHYKEYKVE